MVSVKHIFPYLLLAIHASYTSASIQFQRPEDLPSNIEYDFIIAGGGNGGATVAARLGERQNYNILVIEAGRSNDDVFASRPPGFSRFLPRTPVDWNYTTISQSGVNGRISSYSRGKLLGGCSSHNGMLYTRGSIDDWNNWARITGEDALRWDNILPFMLKGEEWTESKQGENTAEHVDVSLHGTRGPLSVSAPYVNHPFNDMMIQASKELPDEFPYKTDMNDGKPIGIGNSIPLTHEIHMIDLYGVQAWNQFTIDHDSERSSSATAYLAKSKANVHVLLNTQVTRVLPIGKNDFRTVEFAQDANSERRRLTAKKEVIISGGIFGTPQILLNSGIGSREDLEAIGVKTLVDNPSVGRNLSDQVSAIVMFNTTIPVTDYDVDAALVEWNNTRTGPLVLAGRSNHVVFVRMADGTIQFEDPTSGDNSAHIEFVFSQISSHPPVTSVDIPPVPPGTNVTIQILAVNLHPISRGFVKIKSSDPFEYPAIDIGMLTEDVDIAILRETIRSARRLFSAPVFKDSVHGTVVPAANVTTDEQLDEYLRRVASPFLHGTSSASMSPKNANWGVVDPDFRVKGTRGLRVVDAAVLPSVPSGHTQAPVYAMAELAASLITKFHSNG